MPSLAQQADKEVQYTPQQQGALDWFATAAADKAPKFKALVIKARAGSGKTFIIEKGAVFIPTNEPAVFIAFGKRNAEELAERLPKHVPARTYHSICNGTVRQRFPNIELLTKNNEKSYKVIDQLIREKLLPEEAGDCASELANAVAKAKAHGLVPDMPGVKGLGALTQERWVELTDLYEIDVPDDGSLNPLATFVGWCDKVLRRSIERTDVMDFDDMLYLTIVFDLPMRQFPWVIVDEAQDTSHVQLAVLRKILPRSGRSRLIVVGDDRQAIFAFRGADSESLGNIAREFNCEERPLTVSFRCPQAVARLARRLVPDFECLPDAKEGAVLSPDEFATEDFRQTDMIVCRNNAPTFALAYRLIGAGVGARILGRNEIGEVLANLIKRTAGKVRGRPNLGLSIEQFLEKLTRWQERETERAVARGQEEKLDGLNDKVACLDAVVEATDPATVGDLLNGLDNIFKGNRGPTLSSVHKAKGLEAERVFILEPGLLPSPYAKTERAQKQEANLEYVAITRTLDTLMFLPLNNVR